MGLPLRKPPSRRKPVIPHRALLLRNPR